MVIISSLITENSELAVIRSCNFWCSLEWNMTAANNSLTNIWVDDGMSCQWLGYAVVWLSYILHWAMSTFEMWGCKVVEFSDVPKHRTVRTGPKYRSWVLEKCVWCSAVRPMTAVRHRPPRVWLKSPPTPPTPPTLISSPYQLNKQVEQSGEFVSIKWMLTNFLTLFGWS